jgi:hypothetical protein
MQVVWKSGGKDNKEYVEGSKYKGVRILRDRIWKQVRERNDYWPFTVN